MVAKLNENEQRSNVDIKKFSMSNMAPSPVAASSYVILIVTASSTSSYLIQENFSIKSQRTISSMPDPK